MSVGAVKPLKQVIDDGTNATLEEAQSYADAGDAQTLTDAKAYADSKASSSINSEEENPIIVMNLGALGSDDYIFTDNPIVSFKFTALKTSYADTIQSYNSYFGKISIYEENELVYDATAKYERIAPDDGTLPGLPYGYKLDEPVQFTAGKNYDIQVELSSNGFHVDTVSSFNENGTLYNPVTNISVEYTDNNDVLQVISAKSIFSALRFQHSSVGFESGAVKMTGKEIFFNNKQVATEGHEHNKLLSPDTTKEVAYTDNDGNLNITGNIVQQGSAYETHAEQLYTEKDTVIMRDGAVSGLADGVLSGFKILKYDGANNCFFAIDNSGIARIGDEGGELQALATREDAPIDGGIAQWNASELRFKTIPFGTVAGTVAEGNHAHDSRYYTESEVDTKLAEKLDATAKAADSSLLNGLDSQFYYGKNFGDTHQDPNSATSAYILTNHENTPNSSYYWHIRTQFYSTISATGNRAQIAIQYNGGISVYARSIYDGTWTSWKRLDLAYSVSDVVTASTIALRNSSGDIRARLFRSNYGEQTSAPAATADIAFRNSTSDDYIRFMSNAAFSAWCQAAAIKTADSDKVDGYHATTSATANYVAVRDASANLYAADFIQSSDRRLKKNIKPLKKGVDGLIPVSYEWMNKNAKGVNYGFIAQDLVKNFPELVGVDKNGYMNIKQNSIIALLVKDVQDLKRKIKKLKKKLKKKTKKL